MGEKQAQCCTKKIIIQSKLGQRSESALLNRQCLCSLATTVKGVGLTHVSPKHLFEFWLIKTTAKWPVTSQRRCHISKSEPSRQKRQLWPFKNLPVQKKILCIYTAIHPNTKKQTRRRNSLPKTRDDNRDLTSWTENCGRVYLSDLLKFLVCWKENTEFLSTVTCGYNTVKMVGTLVKKGKSGKTKGLGIPPIV